MSKMVGGRILFVATTQYHVEMFLMPLILAASKKYTVYIICKVNNLSRLNDLLPNVSVIDLYIPRKVELINDIKCLSKLIWYLIKFKPDVVHSQTPKAGLLSMLAAFCVGVKCRVHTFTGQVWATMGGLKREFYKFWDLVTAFAATHVIADSQSQADFIVMQGVCTTSKVIVFGKGSVSGVSLERFRKNESARSEIRKYYDISLSSKIILYMARLTRDKGALVMAESYAAYRKLGGDAFLVIVGPDEDGLLSRICEILKPHIHKVKITGQTDYPEKFFSAADIFFLPSYREGFGTVYINAGAASLPAIGSDIYGTRDAIINNETGYLLPAGNVMAFAHALYELDVNDSLRYSQGANAYKYVQEFFDERKIVDWHMSFYSMIMKI